MTTYKGSAQLFFTGLITFWNLWAIIITEEYFGEIKLPTYNQRNLRKTQKYGIARLEN